MRRAALAVMAVLHAACAGSAAGARRTPGSPCADSVAFEPWDAPPTAVAAVAVPAELTPDASRGGLAEALLTRYQRSLRRPEINAAGGCPFEPSCSHFARRAFARYGPVAMLLIIDRLLIREHPLAGSQYVARCVAHRWRWHDPVP